MASHSSDLNVRLQGVPENVLRQIIQSLCLRDRPLERVVLQQVDKYHAIRSSTTARPAKEGDISADEHVTLKRKAEEPATLVCANCKNTYSVADNSDTACSYPTGILDWDQEYFVDTYENDPEPVFEDDPEGFYWTCCEERGDVGIGCIKGRHVPLVAKRQRW